MKHLAFALVFAAFALVSPRAEAREFYKTGSNLELTYTSLVTGTEKVFTLPFEVRYSDDGKFCQVNISSQVLKCYLRDHYGTKKNVFLDRNLWVSLFQGLAGEGVLPMMYFEKLNRIFSKYASDKASYWLLNFQEVYRIQVDDEQPEAFHIQLSRPTEPVVL
jgi:hypothetical protein